MAAVSKDRGSSFLRRYGYLFEERFPCIVLIVQKDDESQATTLAVIPTIHAIQ
ncbi:MAG: hypothetical protein ACI9HK_001461 [Pirellulaceae bacterium]|jgi:hypothetical protein